MKSVPDQSSHVNYFLDAALDYRGRGWSVIPLQPRDKKPLVPWDRLQQQQPTAEEVRQWWQKSPTANVGIALGPVSGMIALDIDGLEALDLAEELFGAEGLPPTLEFSTPGGGLRLFYSISPDCPVTKRRWDRDASHIIVMGQGAQTVMPPSIHPNGKRYEWPAEIKLIAPAPQHVIELATASSMSSEPPPRQPSPRERAGPGSTRPHGGENTLQRARQYLRSCDPAVSGQGGHNQTIKVAIHLVRGFSLDGRTALALLEEEYNPRCVPPWSIKELEHKVAEAEKAMLRSSKANGYLRDKQDPQSSGPKAVAGRPAATKRGPAVSGPQAIDIGQLMSKVFPEPKWAVEGVIPEGGALLAARPKTGKSWLALNIALAVGWGGIALGRIAVERGEVLYLALEDGERRLQDRVKKIVQAQQAQVPEGISFATRWPRSSAGGLDAIDAWLEEHPHCRLVVIDTLARFRDRGAGQGNAYDDDYAAMAAVQELALRRNVAVLGMTHTRKPKNQGSRDDEDSLDEVQNSTGITGAADAVLVLKRPRGTREGALFITGRDLEERTLRIGLDPEYCLWSIRDADPNDPDDSIVSLEWKRVRQAIRKAGRSLSPVEIAQALSKDVNAVSVMLNRMKKSGAIAQEGFGRWNNPAAVPDLPA